MIIDNEDELYGAVIGSWLPALTPSQSTWPVSSALGCCCPHHHRHLLLLLSSKVDTHFAMVCAQNPEDGYNRLKRWIMIGDHHQLPPVIKNMAFQKFSNMEQSLFTRFVHLGVPTVDLDAQGRARPRSVCLSVCLCSVTTSSIIVDICRLH